LTNPGTLPRIASMRFDIWKLLPAFALLFTLSPTGSLSGSEAPRSGSTTPANPCSGYIDWNADQGVWRINCSTSTTCCVYDTLRRFDGSIEVWCDCAADSLAPECCHLLLATFPDNPLRQAKWRTAGLCLEDCGNGPWTDRCTGLSSRFSKEETDKAQMRLVAHCSR